MLKFLNTCMMHFCHEDLYLFSQVQNERGSSVGSPHKIFVLTAYVLSHPLSMHARLSSGSMV